MLYLALAVSFASVVAMTVLVIAEVLIPDGSLPGPIELWRNLGSRVARTRRYWQVIRIAMRHGLGRFMRGQRYSGLETSSARRDLAKSLRRALTRAASPSSSWVRPCPLAATSYRTSSPRSSPFFRIRLSPLDWPTVRAVVESELERSVDDVFAEIDPTPLAAASVAQAHAATLRNGAAVVVKVQRPRVSETVERDLDILARLASTAEERTCLGALDGSAPIGLRLRRCIARGAGLHDRAGQSEQPGRRVWRRLRCASVRVPAAAHQELSTSRVLVMERIDGRPLGVRGAGSSRFRRQGVAAELAAALLDATLDQILVHGIFHVDLHPGNVIVGTDGTLGLLDLGSVARLDSTTRMEMATLLAALERGDSLTATDTLLELVEHPEQIDRSELERGVGALIVRYNSANATVGAAAFAAFLKLVTSHELGIPPDVAAVFRGLATVEGSLTLIDPEFNLLASARESGRERALDSLEPAALRRSLEQELIHLLPLLRRLPRRFDRIADSVEHGRLRVGLRIFSDPDDRRVITHLLHQGLLTVLGAAAGSDGRDAAGHARRTGGDERARACSHCSATRCSSLRWCSCSACWSSSFVVTPAEARISRSGPTS